jgi:hypothetical protein
MIQRLSYVISTDSQPALLHNRLCKNAVDLLLRMTRNGFIELRAQAQLTC